MNEIIETQVKISKLETIGRECDCEFCLPPLKNRHNPFYALGTRDVSKSSKLIMKLSDNDFKYKINFEGNKQIIEVIL